MQIDYNNKLVNVPDFFVVGAPKCGTTSLYDSFLKSNVFFLPKIKEPQFFAYRTKGNNFRNASDHTASTRKRVIVSFDEYLSLFEDAVEDQMIGDFSTHHLRFSADFIRNIQDIYGDKMRDVKIIILLRDPVKRAYSHYMMRVRDGSEVLQFGEAIKPEVIRKRMEEGYFPSYDYIRFSEYFDDINRLRQSFGHVRFFYFEDLIRAPNDIIRNFSEFVGIRDTTWMDTFQLSNANKSGVPKGGLGNQLAFNVIFKKNLLKRIVPSSVKHLFRDFLKNSIGNKLLEKQEIDHQTERFAFSLLEDEYDKLATITDGRYYKNKP